MQSFKSYVIGIVVQYEMYVAEMNGRSRSVQLCGAHGNEILFVWHVSVLCHSAGESMTQSVRRRMKVNIET